MWSEKPVINYAHDKTSKTSKEGTERAYPWLKCPPSGKSSPIIRPFGSTSAVYTAKLAGQPDRLCTLTPHNSGSKPKT